MQFVSVGAAPCGSTSRGRGSVASRQAAAEVRQAGDLGVQGARVLASGLLAFRESEILATFLPVLAGYASLVGSALSAGRGVLREDQITLQAALGRARQLVGAALDLERGDFRLHTYDAALRLAELEPLLRQSLAQAPMVTLRLDLPEEPLLICGLPIAFDRLVLALAVQAREAVKGKGALRLSVRESLFRNGNPAARLRVEDTGRGWGTEVLSVLPDAGFDASAFFEVPGMRPMADLLADQRGVHHLENHLGQGTTLEVRLPLATAFRP